MASATRRAVTPKRKRSVKGKRKAPTNLSLRIDLVERARVLGLNLSEVVEATLEQAIRSAEQQQWLAENDKAIEYYNSFVEKNGLFGEEFREF
jgi:antitoxin CcdA